MFSRISSRGEASSRSITWNVFEVNSNYTQMTENKLITFRTWSFHSTRSCVVTSEQNNLGENPTNKNSIISKRTMGDKRFSVQIKNQWSFQLSTVRAKKEMAFTTTVWLTWMISCADSTNGEQIIIRSHFLPRENQSSLASHYAPVHWISIFDLNRNKDEKLNGVKSVWWGPAINAGNCFSVYCNRSAVPTVPLQMSQQSCIWKRRRVGVYVCKTRRWDDNINLLQNSVVSNGSSVCNSYTLITPLRLQPRSHISQWCTSLSLSLSLVPLMITLPLHLSVGSLSVCFSVLLLGALYLGNSVDVAELSHCQQPISYFRKLLYHI